MVGVQNRAITFPMYAEDLGIKRIGEDITRNEDRKTKLNHDKDTDRA